MHRFISTHLKIWIYMKLVTIMYMFLQVRHTLEECDDQLDFNIPSPAHPHLQHLKVTGVVSDQRFRFLLSHSPALQTIYLDGELEWLHDGAVAVALHINPLPHLEVSLLHVFLQVSKSKLYSNIWCLSFKHWNWELILKIILHKCNYDTLLNGKRMK